MSKDFRLEIYAIKKTTDYTLIHDSAKSIIPKLQDWANKTLPMLSKEMSRV